MKNDDLKNLRNNIKSLKTNGKSIYEKQSSEREAFLSASKNQNKIDEIRASLKAAQLICKMRKKAGLTQINIAEKLHMQQPNYARIERGQNITINTLADIATACGAEIEIKYHLKHA